MYSSILNKFARRSHKDAERRFASTYHLNRSPTAAQSPPSLGSLASPSSSFTSPPPRHETTRDVPLLSPPVEACAEPHPHLLGAASEPAPPAPLPQRNQPHAEEGPELTTMWGVAADPSIDAAEHLHQSPMRLTWPPMMFGLPISPFALLRTPLRTPYADTNWFDDFDFEAESEEAAERSGPFRHSPRRRLALDFDV